MSFPVLSTDDRPVYPADARCPKCGRDFSQGVAYLSAGAILLSPDGHDSIETSRLQAFLHVGFHGVDSAMRDSSDVAVVEDLHGGQFDLNWCSIRCMREWLLSLLQRIEAEVTGHSGSSP
jgi:hypothetical protein